jgi:DNA-binding MarR family transcriptional regulator
MIIEEAIKKGLTIRELWVMEELYDREPRTFTSLYNPHMTPASLTGMLDKLERLGFAKRTRCKKDRRKINLTLTNKGKHFFKDH